MSLLLLGLNVFEASALKLEEPVLNVQAWLSVLNGLPLLTRERLVKLTDSGPQPLSLLKLNAAVGAGKTLTVVFTESLQEAQLLTTKLTL